MTPPVSNPRNRTDEEPTLSIGDIARFLRVLAQARGDAGPDDCWPWPVIDASNGYPDFRIRKRRIRPHRLSLYLHTGVWPVDQLAMHSCDDTTCANFKHLKWGTWAQNIADRDAKGRTSRGSMMACSKLNEALVFYLRERFRDGDQLKGLAADFGLSPCTIRDAVYGRTWTHVAWPEGIAPCRMKTSDEIRARLGLQRPEVPS
jgi:hypothetical protein